MDAFSSVPGTGRGIVGGINAKAVRVYLNPVKLSANDLDIREVESSIRKNNVAVPAGTIEANNVDLKLDIGKTYTAIGCMLWGNLLTTINKDRGKCNCNSVLHGEG